MLLDQLRSLDFEEETKDNEFKKCGKYKQYRYTFDPMAKVLVLVFFDDKTLNKEAEEQGLKI